ncbi:MAG: thioredoxin peroxidase [Myxococcales bacterium]|nr:thioredoxin peroxidase [Myxococcales bacterium]
MQRHVGMTNPVAGERAPEFSLPKDAENHVLRRSELAGKPAVLVFYPADWSPVCGDQLAIYNELRDELGRHNAQLVGISVDGVWCHRAFREHRKFWFPLLSDFEPKGEVARRYGVYRAADGIAERALFVLRPDGVIAWRYVSPVNVNPGADGILDALEQLHAEAA